MESPHMMAVIIAAAGQSLRMGKRRNKALMLCEGKPWAAHLAEVFFKAQVKVVFVTLPDHLLQGTALRPMLRSLGARVTANRFYKEAYSGSIRTALLLLPFAVRALFIMPVDCPYIDSKLIEEMKNIFSLNSLEKQIVIPTHAGRFGHPVLFSRHFFLALQQANQKGGPRGLIAENTAYIRTLHWHDTSILHNHNRPGQF